MNVLYNLISPSRGVITYCVSKEVHVPPVDVVPDHHAVLYAQGFVKFWVKEPNIGWAPFIVYLNLIPRDDTSFVFTVLAAGVVAVRVAVVGVRDAVVVANGSCYALLDHCLKLMNE
jgi:hypothetical protein